MKKEPFRFTLFLLICLSLLMIGTAQAVDVPDPNLRAAIETTLGKASGTPITAAEMETLTFFRAIDANISDLTGLEYATNLTYLFLWNNAISRPDASIGLNQSAISGSSGQLCIGSVACDGLNQSHFSGDPGQLGIRTLAPCGKYGIGGEEWGECGGQPPELPIHLHAHPQPCKAEGFEVRFDSRTPTTLEIISGDAQSDTVGVALAQTVCR